MTEFWFQDYVLSEADRLRPGTALSESQLRELEFQLRGELHDVMRVRGLARLLDASVDEGPEHLVRLLLGRLRAGRIFVSRQENPKVDPEAGLRAKTLAPFMIPDD